MFSIDGNIPSGRITVLAAHRCDDIRLSIPKDPISGFVGWFHFRVSGAKGQDCRFQLVDAGDVQAVRLPCREAHGDRWTDTGPLASYDLVHWFRVPAAYDGQVFSFEHCPEHDLCYYASFAPYSVHREMAMVARAQRDPRVVVQTLGHSIQGRPIDLLAVGKRTADSLRCWVITRQHPSESQGGYFVEGLLERLLDPQDAVGKALLERAVFYIAPNLNPDGAALALSRSNAAGANLNREWTAPDPLRSPEIIAIRQAMETHGVDFCIDCHADDELPFNFMCPAENVGSCHPQRREPFEVFERAWALANSDYRLGHPYPGGLPAQADESMGWNWIGNRFENSLSVLLEQPFKDVHGRPWTPQRAQRLGASCLTALNATLDALTRGKP